jgi:putative membrane protein
MMYDRGYSSMHYAGVGVEWVVMALFWVSVIVGLVFLMRYLINADKTAKVPKALDILEERFAKGEIDSREFAEKRDVLLGTTEVSK